VPLFISGKYYKRYSPFLFNSIGIEFISQPPLQVPVITLSNEASPTIQTTSTSTDSSIAFMIPIIFVGIGIVVTFGFNFYTYMKYNPDENNDPYFCCKTIFTFTVFSFKYIGVGLWIFLFGLTGFAFCFYKFQETVYLILPNVLKDTTSLYSLFELIYYLQFSLILIAVFLLIYDIAYSTDYFLIDW
jgi:hypothetical protein